MPISREVAVVSHASESDDYFDQLSFRKYLLNNYGLLCFSVTLFKTLQYEEVSGNHTIFHG